MGKFIRDHLTFESQFLKGFSNALTLNYFYSKKKKVLFDKASQAIMVKRASRLNDVKSIRQDFSRAITRLN